MHAYRPVVRARCLRTQARPQCAQAASISKHKLRRGAARDVPFIKQRVWAEKMNPWGINPENFVVVESDNNQLIAFAQLEEKKGFGTPDRPVYEFRSLVVAPEHRGTGIGKWLLQEMVDACPHDIYIITVSQLMKFYEDVGFEKVRPPQMPQFMWFEAVAGTVLARLARNDKLIVMRRPRPETASATRS